MGFIEDGIVKDGLGRARERELEEPGLDMRIKEEHHWKITRESK